MVINPETLVRLHNYFVRYIQWSYVFLLHSLGLPGMAVLNDDEILIENRIMNHAQGTAV